MASQPVAQEIQQMAEEVFELMVLSWVGGENNAELEKWDLNEQEVLTLELLSKMETMNVGDLQRAVGVPTTKMSRIIRRLARPSPQPLIETKINSEDRRKIDVTLTAAGREARNAYRSAKLAAIIRVLTDMPTSDRSDLKRIFQGIRAKMLELYMSMAHAS